MAKVSLVITVKDEKATLTKQTRIPDEVIIIDAHQNHKILNRSQGRNLGVKKAKGDIIAFTDAGCIPDKNWLAELVKPFTDKNVQVVSGYYRGNPKSIFEACLVPYVLVMPDKIPQQFFPSTRSMAIRKSLFTETGGFSEAVDPGEDFEYATRLDKLGIKFYFAPKAFVSWRPRKNLKEAAWMFLRMSVGDIQAGLLRPKVKLLFLRYYIFFFLFFLNHWTALLAIPYLIWAVAKNYRYVKDLRAIFWLPVLQLTADICVIFGTIIGVLSKSK